MTPAACRGDAHHDDTTVTPVVCLSERVRVVTAATVTVPVTVNTSESAGCATSGRPSRLPGRPPAPRPHAASVGLVTVTVSRRRRVRLGVDRLQVYTHRSCGRHASVAGGSESATRRRVRRLRHTPACRSAPPHWHAPRPVSASAGSATASSGAMPAAGAAATLSCTAPVRRR